MQLNLTLTKQRIALCDEKSESVTNLVGGCKILAKEEYKRRHKWDMTIQCDHYIEARRPDILVVEKNSNKALIILYCLTWRL